MEADHSHKEPARLFLHKFQTLLEDKLPAPGEMRKQIRDIASKSPRHSNSPEAAFIHEYVVRNLFQLIRDDGLDEHEARKALLCEGYTNIRDYASGTPMHPLPHPFGKVIAAAPDIWRKWQGQKKRESQLTQACPDVAIRHPFKIVFEAKYFERGESDFATRQLVKFIYEAFFYRALPYVPPAQNSQAWGFDFSCLLACDATDKGTLKAAWESLDDWVRDGFWKGANVYVMILRHMG